MTRRRHTLHPPTKMTRSRAIRHITQRYSTDCTVTCVAMVAGVSWQRAVSATFGQRRARQKVSHDDMCIDFVQARDALKRLGVRCRLNVELALGYTLDSFRGPLRLRRPAILMFEWGRTREFHCVVYDPTSGGRFLDPGGDDEGRRFYINEWHRNSCEALVVV